MLISSVTFIDVLDVVHLSVADIACINCRLPNFIELSKHNKYLLSITKIKVTSQRTFTCTRYVTGILLIIA